MPAPGRKAERITSEVDPDLAAVKRFIREKITQGAFAILIASILALLASMRDLNTELRRRLEASRRQATSERDAAPPADGAAFLGNQAGQ
jgi:hypothetical protein